MFAYITTGTPDFLQRLYNKYENENMYFLNTFDHALLLHETDGESVFQMPRKYDVIESVGDIPNKGFAVFHHIPVMDGHKLVFEHELKKRRRIIEYGDGFIAMRILRPIKNDHYLLITCWKDKLSFEYWKEKEAFYVLDEKQKSIEINKIKVYPGQSYLKEYAIGMDK